MTTDTERKELRRRLGVTEARLGEVERELDWEQQRRAEAEQGRQAAERREQAVAQVLTIISRSPADLQAVLDAIIERAAPLLASEHAAVSLFQGASLHTVAAVFNGRLDRVRRLTAPSVYENYLTPHSALGFVASEGRTLAQAGAPSLLVVAQAEMQGRTVEPARQTNDKLSGRCWTGWYVYSG